MAFPSRQGTRALQQCVAITAVTRILGDFFQNDAVQTTAGLPTLLCKASTTWPNTSSQKRPDPLYKLTFPEKRKRSKLWEYF